MSDRLFEFICTSVCCAVIAVSAIIGTYLLMVTMSL